MRQRGSAWCGEFLCAPLRLFAYFSVKKPLEGLTAKSAKNRKDTQRVELGEVARLSRLHGNICRGGTRWPPLLRAYTRRPQRWGGHGVPPLQILRGHLDCGLVRPRRGGTSALSKRVLEAVAPRLLLRQANAAVELRYLTEILPPPSSCSIVVVPFQRLENNSAPLVLA